MKDFEEFLIKKGIKFLKDSSIRDFLTIKIGGQVKFIVIVKRHGQFLELLSELHSRNKRYIVLGGGSNTIFPDGFLDLIAIVNRTSEIKAEDNMMLKVNSGISNSLFLKYCKDNGIAGFEFLSGIPGTLGGATAVNAGAFGNSISDKIVKGEIFTISGEIKTVDKEYFEFRYRNSRFKYGNDVILNIFLKYSYGDKKKISDKIKEIFEQRTSKHPSYSDFSAGCFFKNPVVEGEKISAGKLIEESSLKGYSMNNLKISEFHSNFVINKGNSTFSEILEIEKLIRNRVLKHSGIGLEREVIFVSEKGEKY